jgi:predicted phosphodiesterase
MKVAVLSDIHGNWPALQTVTEHIEKWQPDFVVVAGDIINRGPNSADCLRFVVAKQQTAAWHLIHGNHEGYILEHHAQPNGPSRFNQVSYWTYQQLNGQINHIRRAPASGH